MPSDPFYGGTCVELPFPNDIMNHPFSEPDWTTPNPVCSPTPCKHIPSLSLSIEHLFIHVRLAGTSRNERL